MVASAQGRLVQMEHVYVKWLENGSRTGGDKDGPDRVALTRFKDNSAGVQGHDVHDKNGLVGIEVWPHSRSNSANDVGHQRCVVPCTLLSYKNYVRGGVATQGWQLSYQQCPLVADDKLRHVRLQLHLVAYNGHVREVRPRLPPLHSVDGARCDEDVAFACVGVKAHSSLVQIDPQHLPGGRH